jgi:hypothetical protein
MKLPNFKRLIKSDYAEEFQELVETLGFSINYGVEVLYQALNKSLNLKDNIACTVKDITVEVKEDGTPKVSLSFSLDTSNRILGIVALSATNTTNPSGYPTATPFISFSQSGKTVTITNIKGLPAGQKFVLTVVAFDN